MVPAGWLRDDREGGKPLKEMKNHSKFSPDAISRSGLSCLKIAVVNELLGTYPDADRALEEILVVCPQADLFALADFIPAEKRIFLGERLVATSFIQNLPFARRRFSWYLPLMPFAIEQFDLSKYDLIISNSNGLAKGVISRVPQPHVSYVHGSIDHAVSWSRSRALRNYLRRWDIQTANGVDQFVASSNFAAERISKTYGRRADVIDLPVDVEKSALDEKCPSITERSASRFAAERFRREFQALLTRAVVTSLYEPPCSEPTVFKRVRSSLPQAPA
jgi:hypothetical protein